MAQYIPGVGFVPVGHQSYMDPMREVDAEELYRLLRMGPNDPRFMENKKGYYYSTIDRNGNLLGLDPNEQKLLPKQLNQILYRMAQIQKKIYELRTMFDGRSDNSYVLPAFEGGYRPTQAGFQYLQEIHHREILKFEFDRLRNLYAEYRKLWMYIHINYKLIINPWGPIEMPDEELQRSLHYAEVGKIPVGRLYPHPPTSTLKWLK